MNAKNDPYAPYYNGNHFGQQEHAKSMVLLSKFFKRNGVKTVLDFYCGTGRNAVYLAKHGFDVYGFDRSEMALQMARKRQRDATDGKARFKLHLLEGKLPYEDNAFDAVIVVRALYQARMETIRANVREITRVLKSGGYVYLESNQNFRSWQTKEHKSKVRRIGLREYQYLDNGSFYHFFTKNELRKLFKDYKTVRFYFKERKFYALFMKR